MSETTTSGPETLDPRRWVTLGIALMATLIVVLDNNVLSVAIPTIMAEFDTTLPALQWVLTGYALVFATFLIIGGRLGDLYGHRRTFMVGAALFGTGSLIAALSWNVPSLLVGEALIEGIGASLMLPATLAILSTTFTGRERATAFGLWGAVAGSASALGPVLGGWLTSDFSWRWSFGLNVVIAPLAILGAAFVIRPTPRRAAREPLDLPGAALVAVGMFLVVLGLSEGGRWGWSTPIADVTVMGARVWSGDAAISLIPVIFLVAALVLWTFVRVECRRERDDRGPLFEFGLLQHRTFRYGLLTTMVLAMGQMGLGYSLALFLQEGKHLSALHNGLWVLPMGISILVLSPVGGRLTQRLGTTTVIRIGLVVQAAGLLWIALGIGPGLTFMRLLPGLVAFGCGIGWASAQLTNVVLTDVPPSKSGVASGTNTTVRQVGSTLGISVIGTLLTTQTVSHALELVQGSGTVTASVRDQASDQIRVASTGYHPGSGVPAAAAAELGRIMTQAVAAGTRDALFFAAGVVLIGLLLSLLLPKAGRPGPAVASTPVFGQQDPGPALDVDLDLGLGGARRTGRDHVPEPAHPLSALPPGCAQPRWDPR